MQSVHRHLYSFGWSLTGLAQPHLSIVWGRSRTFALALGVALSVCTELTQPDTRKGGLLGVLARKRHFKDTQGVFKEGADFQSLYPLTVEFKTVIRAAIIAGTGTSWDRCWGTISVHMGNSVSIPALH